MMYLEKAIGILFGFVFAFTVSESIAQEFDVGTSAIVNISQTGTALNIADDSYKSVNLPFTFDLYGQSFDKMNVYQNGVLQLKDDSTAVTSSYCCRGRDLNTLTSSTYDYLLMPLWTDLVNLNSSNKVNRGTTNPYVQSFEDSYIVGWYDVSEYRNNNYKSTFEVELFGDSSFEFRYDKIDVRMHDLTIGYTGDISAGEFEQFLFYDDTNALTYVNNEDFSLFVSTLDCSDPLNNPSCPGYDTALYCSSITFNDFNCSAYTSYIEPVFFEEESFFGEVEEFLDFECCDIFDGVTEEEFFEELPEEIIEEQFFLDEEMIIDDFEMIRDPFETRETFFEEEIIDTPLEVILSRPNVVRPSPETSSPNSAVSDSLAFTNSLVGGLESGVLDYASVSLQQTVNATLSNASNMNSTSRMGASSASSPTGMVMFSNPASNPVSSEAILGSTNTNTMTTSTAPSASSVEAVRIESSLNASSSTSTMNIESQMEQVQEEISEDYFSEDQTKVLALMNYRKGFNAYLVSYLPDNNQWYDPKVIYAGNRNQDNNRALRTLFFSNNSTFRKMIREQYQ
tara:strand:+ start:4199 stop:5899 length:1701 start_codon:yes stop_codon:yes gene_type:complete